MNSDDQFDLAKMINGNKIYIKTINKKVICSDLYSMQKRRKENKRPKIRKSKSYTK
jgi:hypothetical protein